MIDAFKGKHAFLSNFYLRDIRYSGITYPSVEHAYQAAKSLDDDERRRISKLTTPGQAKKAGRMLEIRSDWEEKKLGIMRLLVTRKFSRNDDLTRWLIETDDEELIEGNWWGDTYWGVCRGKGQNYLGKLLMEVRQRCKEMYDA